MLLRFDIFAGVDYYPDPDCSSCSGCGIDPSGYGPCSCTSDHAGGARGAVVASLISLAAIAVVSVAVWVL